MNSLKLAIVSTGRRTPTDTVLRPGLFENPMASNYISPALDLENKIVFPKQRNLLRC